MAKSETRTVAELYEETRALGDQATAAVVLETLEKLRQSGEAKNETPLTDTLVERIQDELQRTVTAGGKATKLAVINMMASTETRVGSANPVEGARQFLEGFKTGTEGIPKRMCVSDLFADDRDCIPRGIANLQMDGSTPLNPSIVDQIQEAALSVAASEFTGNGRGYSDYSEGLYRRFSSTKNGLFRQEMEDLLTRLEAAADKPGAEKIFQRTIHVANCWRAHALPDIFSRSEEEERARKSTELETYYKRMRALCAEKNLDHKELAKEPTTRAKAAGRWVYEPESA